MRISLNDSGIKLNSLNIFFLNSIQKSPILAFICHQKNECKVSVLDGDLV